MQFATLIGGQKVSSRAFVGVQNPWRPRLPPGSTLTSAQLAEQLVGLVGEASAEQVEAALATGHAAEALGAQLTAYNRRQILENLHVLLTARAEAFAGVICAEAGKPIDLARTEVQRALATVRASIEAIGQDVSVIDAGIVPNALGRVAHLQRFARGLVSAITPFNFPLNLVMHKLAPAIAAGCPIVIKPSPQAPISAFLLADLALEAGLPGPMISVVLPDLRDLQPLISDSRVKVLSFTGSAEVGWRLKAQAPRQHVILELGGNAAAIVCPDAALADVIPAIATGAFAYAGQSCISVQRVFVDLDRLDDFLGQLGDHVASRVAVGDPAQPGVICGPMISEAAAARVDGWLDAYAAAGEPILLRGAREGTCLAPAIVQFAGTSRQPLIAEEVFGPVVAICGYERLDDALRCANDSRFGLQAGIFTNESHTLWRAFRELQVGALIHNDVPTFRVDHLPYGGVKDSGIGREGPRFAIEEFTEPRMLVLKQDGTT